MPQTLDKRWTTAEVQALQEQDPSHRYQVVDGELLVSPGPSHRHQRCVGRLHFLLYEFLDRWPSGELFMGPGEVVPDDFTTMQPDVFVVPSEEVERVGDPSDFRRLALACEVLSPSTARLVECWLPDAAQPTIHDVEVHWHPEGAPEPFVLDLVALFQKVHREG